MCRVLAERGFAVTLVAPEPFEDNLVQSSLWNRKIERASRVKRIVLALRAALAANADIYHFHDPELIPLGFALKLLRPSAVVIYDVHEDYPSMMRVKYWIPIALRPMAAKAAYIANAAAGLLMDGIVTADPSVLKDFEGTAGKKAIVHYNFPKTSMFTTPTTKLSAPVADLVYIGGMSDRAGTFVLLDALALLVERGLKVCARLAGYTDGEVGRSAIRARIQSLGLTEQVEFCGRIPHSEVPAWIRSGRIGLVTLQPIAKFLKNIPTKMFEYWACGLPVIASDLPPIREFLQDETNGLLFNPRNPEDLARAIRRLVESPRECHRMGTNGQTQVFESWNNDRQIDTLVNFYAQIGNGAKSRIGASSISA
jgi:glycosyltransferase involved in cell wall biosynthesis